MIPPTRVAVPARRDVFRAMVLVGVVACGGDATNGIAPSAANSYWRFTVNTGAVTMSTVAPYDTIHLSVTPRDAAGRRLEPSLAADLRTRYRLADPTDSSVTVSTDGLIQAYYPTAGTNIIVDATVRGLTFVDTVPVVVTREMKPLRVDTFELRSNVDSIPLHGRFVPGIGWLFAKMDVHASSADGTPIQNIAVAYQSSNELVATVDTVGVVQNPSIARPGRVVISATATIYGVTRTDSIVLEVTSPISANVEASFHFPRASATPVASFQPSVVTISTGGEVAWMNSSDYMIDVVFDDSTAVVQASPNWADYCSTPFADLFCNGGNIDPFSALADSVTHGFRLGLRYRVFPKAGHFSYHSRLSGAKGVVVVQ